LSSNDAPTTSTPQLSRRLGLFSTTLSGVGIILGAGIYVIIGTATRDAGSAVWLAFLFASVLAAMTGLAYAELASMFPLAGASPVYIQEAFGRHAGFVLGWLRLWVSMLTAAAVVIGFGGYLAGLLGLPPAAAALTALALSLAIILAGVRETVIVAVVMTLIEAGGLVLVLALGFDSIGSRPLMEMPRSGVGLLTGATLVFFAFEGFEQIATLSEETRDPTRTIPRAILLSIGICALLYALVAVVAVSVLPWRELASSSSPLADVARAAGGPTYANALSSIALFATFNTALMMLATAARRAYGMANRGMLPALFRIVGQKRKTPWVAALVLTGCSALMVLVGEIGPVAHAANFAIFLSFIAVNTAVVWLRRTRPEAERPFRIPATLGRIRVIPVLSNLGIALLALFSDPKAALAVLVLLAVGILVAPVVVRDAPKA
jgi:APA family basic amino acid/polyamine antiporter